MIIITNSIHYLLLYNKWLQNLNIDLNISFLKILWVSLISVDWLIGELGASTDVKNEKYWDKVLG